MHGAYLIFVLHRSSGGWKVEYANASYFVYSAVRSGLYTIDLARECGGEGVSGEGFAEETVHAGIETCLSVLGQCACGERDDLDVGDLRDLPDCAGRFKAVADRHMDIHEDGIELV